MWKHTETDHICAVKMAVTHYMLSILVRPTCTCSILNPLSFFSHKQYKPVSIYL